MYGTTAEAAWDAALRFVNEVRHQYGAQPILELPRGERKESDMCPLSLGVWGFANITSASTTDDCLEITADKTTAFIDLPPAVQDFVKLFDAGDIPGLDIDVPRPGDLEHEGEWA